MPHYTLNQMLDGSTGLTSWVVDEYYKYYTAQGTMKPEQVESKTQLTNDELQYQIDMLHDSIEKLNKRILELEGK